MALPKKPKKLLRSARLIAEGKAERAKRRKEEQDRALKAAEEYHVLRRKFQEQVSKVCSGWHVHFLNTTDGIAELRLNSGYGGVDHNQLKTLCKIFRCSDMMLDILLEDDGGCCHCSTYSGYLQLFLKGCHFD